MRTTLLAGAAAAALAAATLALAQGHEHSMHRQPDARRPGTVPLADTRQVVHFPRQLREHTLASMRDHLLALQQIQEALSSLDYDEAANIAEQRLGMSSLTLHGAHEVARYMPQGMQEAGAAMHHSASRFAAAAQESAVTGDIKPTLAALARITASCAACHAAYRVQE
ncbi:MAG: hypothetical protein Fur0039_17930 [Rhodocyclaceae bacterium]